MYISMFAIILLQEERTHYYKKGNFPYFTSNNTKLFHYLQKAKWKRISFRLDLVDAIIEKYHSFENVPYIGRPCSEDKPQAYSENTTFKYLLQTNKNSYVENAESVVPKEMEIIND